MVQGLPVIAVTKYGLPVSTSTRGLPVTVSTNGFGLAVTPVLSGGMPVFDLSGTLFGPAVIPANTSPPVITGTTAVDSTLLTSLGTWSGSAANYSFQWKRGGVNIAGATTNVYTLVSADLGAMITVTVTATNTAGSASATSAAVGPVTITAPVNSALPVISGTTTQGQTLSTTTGTWSGSPSYTYQWLRNGSNIAAATTNTYLLVPADVGTMISVKVTATNAGGSANATATAVGPIASSVGDTAPVNTVAPAITGAANVGATLTSTSGTWTGSPTPTYAYQWQRGVPDIAPVNTVAPAITGSLSVNSTLTVTDGTWTGTPTPTYTRQWKRDGVNISGANASTYVLVSGDLGKMIHVTVTATNAAASVQANSNSVGPVTAAGDPHVDAWKTAVAANGGTVSGARSTAVTNFVTTLKGGLNVWAKLDRYWLVAGENAGAAKVDIKAQGLLTISGTPVFTANKGYVTSTANNVDTDFDPTVVNGAYTVNSAHFGGFVNTARTTGSNLLEFGAANGAFTIVSMLNTYEGTYVLGRINGTGNIGNDHNHTARGHWIVSRTGANADAVYYNGSSAGYPNGGGTGTDAAAGRPNCVFSLGCVNQMGARSGYSGDQISSFFAGGGLSAAEALELYNAEVTLMTAIGVLP